MADDMTIDAVGGGGGVDSSLSAPPQQNLQVADASPVASASPMDGVARASDRFIPSGDDASADPGSSPLARNIGQSLTESRRSADDRAAKPKQDGDDPEQAGTDKAAQPKAAGERSEQPKAGDNKSDKSDKSDQADKSDRALKRGDGMGKGSKPDEQVRSMQDQLKRAGISPGKLDGKFGPKTEAAVREFQKKNGLNPTGVADADTMNALKNAPAAPQQQRPGAAEQPGQVPAGGGTNAQRLARIAREGTTRPDSQYNHDGHHCMHFVKQDLARLGINVTGVPAAGAANQLANNPNVDEIKGLRNDQLRNLPAGAVVVWGAGNGHQYGHISVAMGDGTEASDVMRRQITNYGTRFRVFMPK